MIEPARVVFELTDSDGAGDGTETLWASRTSDGSLLIDNIPLLHKGVSSGDKVKGVHVSGNVFQFEELIEPSSNSTIQLVGPADSEGRKRTEAWLRVLSASGCKYEGGAFGADWRYGISVPQEVSLDLISDYFDAGEKQGLWQWRISNERHASDDRTRIGDDREFRARLASMLDEARRAEGGG